MESVAFTVLDTLGEAGITLGDEDGIRPRLNVLLEYRPWYRFFIGRYLRIVWSLGMENQPDVGISFPVSKGLAGEVFRTKVPKLANTEESGHEQWGFSEKEIEQYQFKQLKAIYSWPIYEIDRKNRQTGKVIGTVNFDARTAGAAGRIKARQEEYERFLTFFSELVSKMIS